MLPFTDPDAVAGVTEDDGLDENVVTGVHLDDDNSKDDDGVTGIDEGGPGGTVAVVAVEVATAAMEDEAGFSDPGPPVAKSLMPVVVPVVEAVNGGEGVGWYIDSANNRIRLMDALKYGNGVKTIGQNFLAAGGYDPVLLPSVRV